MKKDRRFLRRLLPAVLALALLFPAAGPAVTAPSSAAKVTQEEINALKRNANDIAARKKDIQNQLKAIRADKSKALNSKELLEDQIDLIQDEIDNIAQQIAAYDQLIGEKEVQLTQLETEEQQQYDLFCQRVRYMEEEGDVSYWSILFSSKSFSDLLDNFMMVEEIMEYDDKVMNDLIALQEQIQQEKDDVEQARQEQQAAKTEQEAKRSELKGQQDEVDALIKEISAQESVLKQAEQELKAAADAADAEIRRKEKELAAQIANVVSESGFQWPLPAGYDTLTSLFGSRTHPITGKPNNHTGIDIPAPGGTSIYAAKSGVVITSVKKGSYGNYVVVAHSDGTSTLYAHMSKRAVSEGATVKQGQVIGYVGTTGSSTGNHLHFEVRVNGTRKDPVNYFKDKTLYVTSGGKKAKLSH